MKRDILQILACTKGPIAMKIIGIVWLVPVKYLFLMGKEEMAAVPRLKNVYHFWRDLRLLPTV